MMALGRIELASTLSLYGKSKLPFEAIEPTKFEAEQYLLILSDDTVAHLKSLAGEQGFKEVLGRGAGPTPGRWPTSGDSS